MNYLTADAEIRRMAQGLRDYSDDKLGALSRHGSGLGIDAANYEMFRRIACKVPPTREPMPIEQVLGLQAAAAHAARHRRRKIRVPRERDGFGVGV